MSRPIAESHTGRHLEACVIEHEEIAPSTRRIVLHAPELAGCAAPGQFVHVLCGASHDPLLRRPFSIHDADPESGRVSLLYEVRGRGTALLAEKASGEPLDMLGPLGQGFALPESSEESLILVAGGIGVAPLYFLARKIADASVCDGVTVLIGARTEEMLLCVNELSQLASDVKVSTDDGSRGYHGLVTGLLDEYIEDAQGTSRPRVFACGPMSMLKAVAQVAETRGLNCQVSTEARMACGVGACMSCVVKVRAGSAPDASYRYVRACREGPVFDADEVIWE